MKTTQLLKFSRVFGVVALVILSGCITAATGATSPSPVITMTSPNHFVICDENVESSGLVKALRKNHVPREDPLVIEMSGSIPFEAIKSTTQILATAGYKPVFKNPRHANVSVGGQGAPFTKAPATKKP